MKATMKKLVPALVAAQLAIPALAQDDHSHHGHEPAPAVPAAPPHDHATPPAPAVQQQDHADPAHDHPAPAAPSAHEHGRSAPAAPSAHQHGPASAAPAAPVDAARFPPPTAEELRAAFPDTGAHDHMGGYTFVKWQLDRLEVREDDRSELFWDGSVSWGSELDRIWLGSEGETQAGVTGRETELFWTHAFSRWWETRLGVRRDTATGGEDRDWLQLGVQGTAPFDIDVEATAFAGKDKRTALRLELEYELRLTNRLQLVPRFEASAYGRDDFANGIAGGLADSEFGLRLRYELRREIVPYVGVHWSRLHGDTAALARSAGHSAGEAQALLGVSLWY